MSLYDGTLTGTLSSGEKCAPSVFVEQLYQGTPYADIIFPDAFEISPGSWDFRVLVSDADEEKLPDIHENRVSQMGSQLSNSLAKQQGCAREKQQGSLRHRINKRLALKNAPGETVYERENYSPAATAATSFGATNERLRQEEARDWAHAVWATQNRESIMWCLRRRLAGIAFLSARRQEREELEYYAGSTRDKLILSRKARVRPISAPSRWAEIQNDTESRVMGE